LTGVLLLLTVMLALIVGFPPRCPAASASRWRNPRPTWIFRRHFAFTQVLQTESGRPMTIQLFATSSNAVSWLSRLGTGLIAFGILWGMVAAVSRVTRRLPAHN
jgi:hypothetical protein